MPLRCVETLLLFICWFGHFSSNERPILLKVMNRWRIAQYQFQCDIFWLSLFEIRHCQFIAHQSRLCQTCWYSRLHKVRLCESYSKRKDLVIFIYASTRRCLSVIDNVWSSHTFTSRSAQDQVLTGLFTVGYTISFMQKLSQKAG